MLPLGASEREQHQMGQVFVFPYGDQPVRRQETFTCPEPEIPCVENFDIHQTRDMWKLANSIMERAKELIEFVDSNRTLAKRVGIETIGIELAGMIEGERLRQVRDALQLAASRNRGECITEDGLTTLRRAEKLLAEANASIVEYSGVSSDRPLEAVRLGQQQASQPQAQPVSNVIHNNTAGNPSGGENALIVPMVIIGVVGLAAIIAVIAFTSSRGER